MSIKPTELIIAGYIRKSSQEIFNDFLDINRCSESKGYSIRPGIENACFESRTPQVVGSRIRVRNTDGSSHIDEIWEFHHAADGTEVSRRMSMYPKGLPGWSIPVPISRLMKKAFLRNLVQTADEEYTQREGLLTNIDHPSFYWRRTMLLPDYWLTRPSVDLEASAGIAFDELLEATLRMGGCPTIPYTLPWPKWQFLCHLGDHHDIALHGSGNPDIALFEPRQSNDLSEFGNQKAVYAASDGIWAMFFAIVDRDRVMSITNACVRLADQTGTLHGPYYVFSVSQSALPNQPWRTGTVYLLPRRTFITQSPMPFGSFQVQIAQLAAFEPVQPLAKLTITAEDFPFLLQIRGHDDQRLQEYATALQTGAPWPGDV